MNSNTVHNKLIKLAPNATFPDFWRVLTTLATPSNPVRTTWLREDGTQATYKLYWINGPIGDGVSGGSDTKAAKNPAQYNVPVIDADGSWRTLTTGDRVISFSFNNFRFRLQ
jgi:hypothetical protein